jgi:inositol oxygenase
MRSFDNLPLDSKIRQTYTDIYSYQNLKVVQQLKDKYKPGNHGSFSIRNILEKFSSVIDDSDPDTDHCQDVHAYQSAERLRHMYFQDDKFVNPKIKDVFTKDIPKEIDSIKDLTFEDVYPNMDWSTLSLVGLIHDMGKVLTLSKWESLDQFLVVGDSFPVGIKLDPGVVLYQHGQDYLDAKLYPRKFGIYQAHIGLDNLTFSFSHDNYLFDVLSNSCKLPSEALYMIRYHSFYPWVSPINKRCYTYLASKDDWYRLPLLKMFQKADLYSKDEDIPNIHQLKSYYYDLIDKYIPGKLKW